MDGKVALVTGAGRGLGAEIAFALGAAGADLVLLSRTPSELEKVAQDISAAGGRAKTVVCDVTQVSQVRSAIGSLDRLDILLNNAGTNFPEPFIEVTEERLDRQISLNVRAMFTVAQAAVKKMLEAPDRKQRGGVVINMSSQMGHIGAERRTVYCMTKHAVEGLTKAMAVELAPQNIRVNAVAPTFLETPMTQPMLANPDFYEWTISRIPLGRIGQLSEVTGAVVFLASPAASLVTGTSLRVDGGWTAR